MTPENQNKNNQDFDAAQINNQSIHQPGDQFQPAFSDSTGQNQSDHYVNQSPQTSSPSSPKPAPPLSHNYVAPSSDMMASPPPAAMPAQAPATPATNVMANPNLAIATIPKKKKNLWLLIGLPLILFLLFAGGAFAAHKILVAEPRDALANYVKKVATAKSANFEATASWHALEEKDDKAVGAPANSSVLPGSISASVKGAYDLHDKNQPKSELTASAKAAEVQVAQVSLMSFVDEIFFKFDAGSFLSGFGVKPDNKWYMMKVDTALKDIGKDNCKLDADANGLLAWPIVSALPVKNTKRVSFSEKIAGHNTAHYSGEIDFSKITAYVDSLNRKLPAQCKITVKQSDFDGISIVYDLYNSKNFDRMDLKIKAKSAKADIGLTLDTQNYNQPIAIDKPADAKQISNIMEIFTSPGSLDQAALEATPEKGRDSQRKSDLRNIKTALESYFVDNGSYPSRNNWKTELTKGSSPYMKSLPKDPKTGQDYVYNGTPNQPPFTGYTLSATLEDKTDKDAKAGVYTVTNAQ